MNDRKAEELAISEFVASGRMKRLPPVTDPYERAMELRRGRDTKEFSHFGRRGRGRPRKSPKMLGLFIGAVYAATLAASAAIILPAHADPAKGVLQKWTADNERCRGGPGNDPRTWTFCAARDKDDKKLKALGWCYGEPDQYEYQKEWHKCAANAAQARKATASPAVAQDGCPAPHEDYRRPPLGIFGHHVDACLGDKIEVAASLEVPPDGDFAMLKIPQTPAWSVDISGLPQDDISYLREHCEPDLPCVAHFKLTVVKIEGEAEVVRPGRWREGGCHGSAAPCVTATLDGWR